MISLKKSGVKCLFFTLFSIIFISIFSKSTSVFLSKTYIIDSAIFQIIGRGITKGLIPYKDLFDHKGPILFYIEALGYLINKSWGIYFLQIINIFISSILLEKLISLFTQNYKKKIVSLILSFAFLRIIFFRRKSFRRMVFKFYFNCFIFKLKSSV